MSQQITIYTYKKCGTCRKALQWLAARGISCTEVPIREQPPSREELQRMLGAYNGEMRKLFNTSGRDYREEDLKTRLPGMDAEEALDLLGSNGNLIKRPFLVLETTGRVGFKEAEWEELLG